MSIVCITCGRIIPDNSEFCPSCGRAVQATGDAEPAAPPATTATAGTSRVKSALKEVVPASYAHQSSPPIAWNDRVVAASSYLTIIPAVAFLFMKPYARRQFVRFHSLQSISFWILALVLLGIGILASTFGFLLIWLFTGALVVLGLSLTWLVLSIKALQGEWFEVPGLGYFAAQVRR